MATKTAPSVLAFARKLDPSDALFYAGDWDLRGSDEGWQPIAIREKSVRGTISNRLKARGQDPAKLDAAIVKPNPQKVDVATLPSDVDTLKVVFTLRVLGDTGRPSACNDADYLKKLTATVRGYIDTHGFGELGRRYAFNLANGRFLWRNRIGAEQVEVHVAHLVRGAPQDSWVFDAFAFPLRSFDAPSAATAALDSLSSLIVDGLTGRQHILLLVTGFARIGAGQEVFPSQELIFKRKPGDKKTLYDVAGVAGIHSQKIGNALRTIDTWYEGAEEIGPIAIEPYGSVTTQAKAYRQPKQKLDFYSLLDGWILKEKVPPLEQQHFVMATLIRGGVYC